MVTDWTSPGSPEDGVPVYLLHGLLGTASAHFGRQIRAWRGHRVVRGIDLPGHGRSSVDAERPYWACAVRQVMDELRRHGPSDLVAVSHLGGTVAARVAAAEPSLVRSLVLSGFVPDVPRQAVKAWVEAFGPLADGDPALAEEYRRLHGIRWRRTLQVVAAEIATRYDEDVRVPVELLAELAVPTLVVNGTRRGDERQVAAWLPITPGKLDVGLIPNAGHMTPHEVPELFNAMVERFWAGLDGVPGKAVANVALG